MVLPMNDYHSDVSQWFYFPFTVLSVIYEGPIRY